MHLCSIMENKTNYPYSIKINHLRTDTKTAFNDLLNEVRRTGVNIREHNKYVNKKCGFAFLNFDNEFDWHRCYDVLTSLDCSQFALPGKELKIKQRWADIEHNEEEELTTGAGFVAGAKYPGNEDRNCEFKQRTFVLTGLRHLVRRNICAFLNSEGGSLLFGIGDDGWYLVQLHSCITSWRLS